MGKTRNSVPMNVPFYSTQPAKMPIVVPPTVGGGITLITGRPGYGKSSPVGHWATFGIPHGDDTEASHQEQMEILAISNRLRFKAKEPALRNLTRLATVYQRAETKGKLRLLQFYDRYVSLRGNMGQMFETGELVLTTLHPLDDKRVTAANIHAIGEIAAVVPAQLSVFEKRALLHLAFTHWRRSAQIVSIIQDRGITNDRAIATLLLEMDQHPEVLSEGVL